MKFPTKFAVLLFASMIVVTSCNKDDDDPPVTPPSATSLLTSHEWIMTNVTLGFPLNGINAWDSVPPCEKDNFYKFNTDNTGWIDHSTLKCDPMSPQVETFEWTWKDNQTSLEIVSDTVNPPTVFKNVVVTATTMTGKTDWEMGGITATANITFGVH